MWQHRMQRERQYEEYFSAHVVGYRLTCPYLPVFVECTAITTFVISKYFERVDGLSPLSGHGLNFLFFSGKIGFMVMGIMEEICPNDH